MKLDKIYKILLEEYGSQGWWPLHGVHSGKTPQNKNERFEISIGAILTQNTNWNNVEKALKKIRPITIERLDLLPEKKLAKLIQSSGYYNQKAKKIKFLIKFLKERKKITRENLLNIWGLGFETVDSILLYAYNKPFFVIDAYTKRIFERLGFEFDSYEDWQSFFHKNFGNDISKYKEFHALIVKHAKQHCKIKPLCEDCKLQDFCDFI